MFELRGFEPRLYQQTIMGTAIKSNTLVVLPTGKGKTKLAIMIALHRLNCFPGSKVLFLTPTKPLATQIGKEFKECSTIDEVEIFSGEVKPELRKDLWNNSRVIVSTPQTISNDVISGNVDLRHVSLLVVDESHLATGDYDYVWIAKQYYNKGDYPRIVGLTASPGDNVESINEVCNNLFIEDVEVRTLEDHDIKPYVFETETEYVMVELGSEFAAVRKYLNDALEKRVKMLKEYGLTKSKLISKKVLLDIQRELQSQIATGEADPLTWSGISLVAEVIKVQHALELLETQGVVALQEYFKKVFSEAVKGKAKSTKKVAEDVDFKSASYKCDKLVENKVLHPKLVKLKEIVTEEVKVCEKILIFNNFRDSASKLKEELDKIEGVKSELFVGQVKKKNTGLTQKKQIEMLERFKAGEFNVIIMTSVGELGLDIPAVDLIVFYEPVPSAIRQIQRRGRTSRHKEGKLKVLVTKGTRDEAYRWSAHHKEKRMHTILDDLKNKIKLNKGQKSLDSFATKLKVFADSRERSSGILKMLAERNADLVLKNLEVGDFVLSERVGVERKEVRDFVDSIVDKRILKQMQELKKNFEKPLLVIEGREDIYAVRNVHSNAIRGMLAYITVDLGVPIVYTRDNKDTVEFLLTVAKREQEDSKKDFSLRGEKKPLTLKEQQEFIVGGFPGVGGLLAKNLLKEFGSVKSVVNASVDELKDVEKIGKKKAEQIRKVLDEDYL